MNTNVNLLMKIELVLKLVNYQNITPLFIKHFYINIQINIFIDQNKELNNYFFSDKSIKSILTINQKVLIVS